MAKNDKKKGQEEQMEEQNPEITFGQVDEILAAGAEEVDPFESIPTVVPGKPGFDKVGQVLAGIFVRTKRVVSDKFTAGRIDPKTGETYRLLHILRDAKGVVFGIWSVGQLGAAMKCLSEGDYIEVIFDGQAEKALRPGQTPPFMFKYRARRADGSKLSFDWDKINAADEAEHMPPQTAANNATATQARQ